MTFTAAVITTFPDDMFDVYAKKMLQSFSPNWPAEIPLLVALDDDLLLPSVQKFLRPQDAACVGWGKEHGEFVARNKGKDDPQNYRKMPVRFCHKVFTMARALDTAMQQKKAGEVSPRYLLWMDADVIINRPVGLRDIEECLPKEGDAAATLQRKDWPHSECGWMSFDLENGGDKIIVEMFKVYVNDTVLKQEQKHDSWIFDQVVKALGVKVTNLTPDVPGMDVWQLSPMGKWSRHYKGPMAKQELINLPRPQVAQGQPQQVIIQTQNAIPHEEIRAHITENQKLIKNWVKPCIKHDEEVVIVSAGPLLIAENVREEKGKRIVAVKHAIEPLKKAGIKPWACILLDPREHVSDFVKNPDTDIIWFVASQVEPEVTRSLLLAGCKVWGYHAAVGAGEQDLTAKESYAIISGGSATATRGMFLMSHLGFSRFRLYGYELSIPDKPDTNARDERGQPKYMELNVGFTDRNIVRKKHFWTEPQYVAQFEEMKGIIESEKFEIKAFGDGVVPFLVHSKEASDLRNRELAAKIMGDKTYSYEELLGCRTSKINWRKWLPSSLRRRKLASKF